MGFALIIKLILIGIMLISAISYMIQRAGNKQNLKHAINTNPSTRQLTDEELLLLKPYLDDKELVKPYKYQPELVSRDVTAIEGECIRHSTTTNGTETSYYFTIGGIEVFMPYGMEGYTMTYNVAEVVFTKQYAFVISLNGYTLFTAKSERDLEDKLDEQWHNGIRGDFKKLSDQELAEIRQTELTSEIKPFIQQAQNRRCQILEQRDETRLEQASKSTLNTGFLSAVFLVLTFIFAINYKDNDLLLLIISLICLVLSVVFYFKRFKVEPRKINRVRGTIEVKNSEDLELCIGDNLLVTYPKYWDSLLPEKTTIETEFDVTVGSKQLLKYGHHCSIANEIDHYGSPKFWGRNCFLFIVGFILTLFLFFFPAQLKAIYNSLIITYLNQRNYG